MILQIVQGDLLEQDVDVIVNAWNRNFIPWWLLLPQGVSGAIKRRGGTGPFKELRKHGSIPLGGAVLTSAGRLPFKAIIHVAGINMFWRASEASIRNSVRNAIILAHEKGFKSIAFPLIGAGSGGFNQDRAKAIMEDELQKMDYPLEVRLVVFGGVRSDPLKGPAMKEDNANMKDYQAIKNHELLTSVFGRWPSFHDAEVIWLLFDRRESSLGYGPTVETLIHAFEMTKEVDAKGYFVLRNHVLVHLRYSNVAMPEMGGFNHQNAIIGLNIRDISDRQMEQVKFDVLFEPAYGLGAKFQCQAIEVVSVEPCGGDLVGERGGPKPVA